MKAIKSSRIICLHGVVSGYVYFRDGKILEITDKALPVEEIYDASDRWVSPGFIDTHTHADLDLLRDKQHAYALQQGVTTEIIGPCGLGYFPLSDEKLVEYAKYLEGLNGPLPEGIRYNDLSGYLEAVEGCGINVAANISHSAVRMAALGFSDAPLKGEALEYAKNCIRTAAEQGAVGFSTGLSYFPATYADDEEVITLASVAGEYGLPLASHCRTIFPDTKYNMDSRYQEFIDMAREGGFPLHFSHTKHKPSSAGNYDEFFAPFEAAMAEGLDIGTVLNKKTIAASYIYQMLLDASVLNVRNLTSADAEVVELMAEEGSRITKCKIRDMRLPKDAFKRVANGCCAIIGRSNDRYIHAFVLSSSSYMSICFCTTILMSNSRSAFSRAFLPILIRKAG